MNCAVNPLAETEFSTTDKRWMRLACLYAGRAQGLASPNPAVGCVLVSADDRLLAIGCTQAGGRPHAEAAALQSAALSGQTAQVRGGTAYVTLEPCAHKGRGPACADLLVNAGVSRVVYAVEDPDERVNGQGRARLANAGVAVQSGLYQHIAKTGLDGFLSSRRRSRPFVISKVATSADGFISAEAGKQTWLTNEVSRRYVHDLRSRVDGLITGIQTVLVDDPALTCRLAGGQGRTPVRLVLDSKARLRVDSQLVKTLSAGRVVVFCGADADATSRARLHAAGVEVVVISRSKTGLDLEEMLQWCEQHGLSTVLIEAGTKVNISLFEAGFLDRVIHLMSPNSLNEGVSGVLSEANVASALAFHDDSAYIRVRSDYLADDRLTIWQKAE